MYKQYVPKALVRKLRDVLCFALFVLKFVLDILSKSIKKALIKKAFDGSKI